MGKLGQCKMMGRGLEVCVECGGECLWYKFVTLNRVIKTSLSDKATFEEIRKTFKSSKLCYVHSAPSPQIRGWMDEQSTSDSHYNVSDVVLFIYSVSSNPRDDPMIMISTLFFSCENRDSERIQNIVQNYLVPKWWDWDFHLAPPTPKPMLFWRPRCWWRLGSGGVGSAVSSRHSSEPIPHLRKSPCIIAHKDRAALRLGAPLVV